MKIKRIYMYTYLIMLGVLSHATERERERKIDR